MGPRLLGLLLALLLPFQFSDFPSFLSRPLLYLPLAFCLALTLHSLPEFTIQPNDLPRPLLKAGNRTIP